MAAPGPKLLNFAAGPYPREGWINADTVPSAHVYMDATKPLPIPDNCLDAVFSEHFLEHLDFKAGRRWMADCYRCLKPGGVLRVATPGIRQIYEMYAGSSPHVSVDMVMARHFSRFARQIAKAYGGDCPEHPCIVFNDKLRLWGAHRFIYDEDLLRLYLRRGPTPTNPHIDRLPEYRGCRVR